MIKCSSSHSSFTEWLNAFSYWSALWKVNLWKPNKSFKALYRISSQRLIDKSIGSKTLFSWIMLVSFKSDGVEFCDNVSLISEIFLLTFLSILLASSILNLTSTDFCLTWTDEVFLKMFILFFPRYFAVSLRFCALRTTTIFVPSESPGTRHRQTM